MSKQLKAEYLKSNDSYRIPATLSYPNLFKPRAAGGGDPKYSANFIVSRKTDISALEDGIEAVVQEEWGKKSTPRNLRLPIRNGSDYEGKDGYDDSVVFFSARSTSRPMVKSLQDRADIYDEDEIYPGAKVLAIVRPFAYTYEGNKGVGLALLGVIKVGDGERLGGGGLTEEDAFAGMNDTDWDDLDEAAPF